MTKVKQSQLWPGLWPGVAAIVGDAEMLCVPCAKWRYGAAPVQRVIDGEPGYERYTDHEGNVLGVVLHGSEDLHGEFCGRCHGPLCEEECACYPHEICEGCGERWIAAPRFIRNGVCMTCRSVMPSMWVD